MNCFTVLLQSSFCSQVDCNSGWLIAYSYSNLLTLQRERRICLRLLIITFALFLVQEICHQRKQNSWDFRCRFLISGYIYRLLEWRHRRYFHHFCPLEKQLLSSVSQSYLHYFPCHKSKLSLFLNGGRVIPATETYRKEGSL